MRQIPLTQEQVALVDNADYKWLRQWKWFADRKGAAPRFFYYAMRSTPVVKGKRGFEAVWGRHRISTQGTLTIQGHPCA